MGYALKLAKDRFMEDGCSIRELLDRLDALFDASGLDGLDPFVREGRHPGSFARPRRFEVAAALNRLRSLRVDRVGERSPG